MKTITTQWASILGIAGVCLLSPQAFASEFHEPEQVLAGGEAVAAESPGFACPTYVDVDGDGVRDLVVGQFSRGKMQFFKGMKPEGDGMAMAVEKGTWIQTKGKPAEVSGVW